MEWHPVSALIIALSCASPESTRSSLDPGPASPRLHTMAGHAIFTGLTRRESTAYIGLIPLGVQGVPQGSGLRGGLWWSILVFCHYGCAFFYPPSLRSLLVFITLLLFMGPEFIFITDALPASVSLSSLSSFSTIIWVLNFGQFLYFLLLSVFRVIPSHLLCF